jgi:hypothetical protein
MKSGVKLTAIIVGSLAVGAVSMLALSFANPLASRPKTAAITQPAADGHTLETFYFEAPEDGIAATHDGNKPIQAFPQGIPAFSEKNLASAFLLVAKARNKHGEIVGFASEMEDVAPESNIMQGRMIMHSTWTLEIPGRGTLFMFEIENASEFAKKVVIPALAFGKTWNEPWTFTTTIGPHADGRGIITGGTGEFAGATGTFVEVTHLRKFTPDGQMFLTMELQLAYKTAKQTEDA